MERKKKKFLRGIIGFVGISFLFAILQQTAIFKSFEVQTLDLRFRFFNDRTDFSSDIVIIDIDDESIKNLAPSYGRWPWPRHVYKEIIDFVNAGQPSSIIFDFLFTEEQKGTDDDAQLAEISKLSANVSHAVFLLKETSLEGKDFIDLTPEAKNLLKINWKNQKKPAVKGSEKYKDFLLPNPILEQNAQLNHIVNVEPDNDGILRKIPLLFAYGSDYFPSLAMRGLLSRIKNPQLEIIDGKILVYENANLKWKIPIDENMHLQLNYYNSKVSPKIYRVGEVIEAQRKILEGNADLPLSPEVFQGKTVIIGTSAIGLNDLKVTPLAQQFPGVFLHATGISNVLKNDYVKKPDFLIWILANLLIILLIELFIFSFDSLIIRNMVSPLLLFVYLGLSIFYFRFYSYNLPMANPLIFGMLALLDGYIYIALVEGKARKKMESALSKYLSPNVTKHLISSGVDPTAEVGTHKELTILFSDLRGFTTLSEKMEPVSLVHLLNEYLSKMTDIVFDHDGTLDKFIGDAVMAFWGAPLDDPHHFDNAVKTGLHMVRELEKLNLKWKAEGLPQLKVGIGILSGKVIVGNIGGAKRLDYTVIGDNVNTTSRLEGLTKEYDCRIIMAESTYEVVKNNFVIRILDMVVAKGKTKAIKIFEPLIERNQGLEIQSLEILANKFNSAWEMYQTGNFEESLKAYHLIAAEYPDDGPTKVYIERCKDLILNPPSEWTGVFVATHK